MVLYPPQVSLLPSHLMSHTASRVEACFSMSSDALPHQLQQPVAVSGHTQCRYNGQEINEYGRRVYGRQGDITNEGITRARAEPRVIRGLLQSGAFVSCPAGLLGELNVHGTHCLLNVVGRDAK